MSSSAVLDHPDAIAIIGMAGRFPGAPTIADFWRNLQEGVESITFFDAASLQAAGVDPAPLARPDFVPASGYLAGSDLFDAEFFALSRREAELTDPQHRLLLESAWEALEDAGYDPATYQGYIGVYVGASTNSYLLHNLVGHENGAAPTGGFHTTLGNSNDFLATRLSYKLDLKGIGLTVQSACSTSLVAVHLACKSLLDGECDMVLAGGAGIHFPQESGYFYQEGGILSADGHCRPFDAQATGTVRGNGVGLVLLKRLADALADGDHLYAVIRGSAVNNDGAAKLGYTAPSVIGQAAVIAEALAMAQVPAASIGYVEAHGTATPLGDPIELMALTEAFGPDLPLQQCALGAVKGNIGHLDAAAGIAGLIKCALALHHEQLPPTLHFQQPNPKIDFAHSPFRVVHALTDWPRHAQPRRAGVSAFGIGGTNVHAVLEEAPRPSPAAATTRPWQLLLLSARSPAALDAASARLADYLRAHPAIPLADVAFTLAVGRRAFPHRRAVLCQGVADAIEALSGAAPARVIQGEAAETPPPLLFLFPGQGSQYPAMARALYQSELAFQQALDDCLAALPPELAGALFPAPGEEAAAAARLQQTALAQPALFAIEYALATLLQHWGLRPQAMVGHSIGEYAAACVAGVLPLHQALALVRQRAALMQALPSGAMLAVPLSAEAIMPWLSEGISLAADNGPQRVVLSGPHAAITHLQQRLHEGGIASRLLHTSHAFHSAMMEPIMAPLTEQARRLTPQPPRIPYLSNLTGHWISDQQATDPAYWAQHLRHPVRFAESMAPLLAQPSLLLEVGPGRTLTSLVRAMPGAASQALIPTLPAPREPDEGNSLLAAVGKLWVAGASPDWHAFYGHEARRRLSLPSYPFERQRHWVAPPAARPAAQGAPAVTPPPEAASALGGLFLQQLALMNDQLDLLQGRADPASDAPTR